MDETLTSGTDVVGDLGAWSVPGAPPGEDQGVTPVTPDPAAPFGRKPDGTPYKRDPNVMRAVRAARFGGGRRRAAPPRAASPTRTPDAPKGTRKPSAPKYGVTIARWMVRGTDALLPDPVDRQIFRTQSVQLALILDKMCAEDPRFVQWIERLRLRLAGGAKGELVAWSATTGLLVAMNRGYRHPMLALALGGALEQIKVQAAQYEQAALAERVDMERMFAELAAEEERIRAEALASMHEAAAMADATPGRDILGQFERESP